MWKKSLVLLMLFALLCIIGCFAGPNPEAYTPNSDGDYAGFWSGLWHGLVAPFSFLLSLCTRSISFYEVHNNGGWYNFGFVLGSGIFSQLIPKFKNAND